MAKMTEEKKQMKKARGAFFAKNEEFQKLFIESKIEVVTKPQTVTAKLAHIYNFAKGIEGKMSLDNMFKTYCLSKGGSFRASDLITIKDWADFQKCTIKACISGNGLFKVINGEKYFFQITRDKVTGELSGEWAPFASLDGLFNVSVMTEEEYKVRKAEKEKRQLAKLLKKYSK